MIILPPGILIGYYPKDKEINLSDEEINSILSYINMYLIMNVVLEIDKLLDILRNSNGFDVTRDELNRLRQIQIISCNVALNVNLPKKIQFDSDNKIDCKYINIRLEQTLNIEQVKKLINASKNTPIYLHVLFAVLLD